MVRYINTRDGGNGENNGKSFRVGETVFVVAAPATPRPQNRTHGFSLTSLTIPMPVDEVEQDQDLTERAPAQPTAGRDDFDVNDEGSDHDAAQLTGTELLAPPALPESLERRL